MIQFLLSIPPRVKLLTDRLTAARAQALDSVSETRMARLDAAVSSRAAAATALSSNVWTSGHADKLNNLPSGVVKRVLSGYVETTEALYGYALEDRRYVDITISAVDPDKCIVSCIGTAAGTHSGGYIFWTTSVPTYIVSARLTGPTTLRVHVGRSNAGCILAHWKIVEFY